MSLRHTTMCLAVATLMTALAPAASSQSDASKACRNDAKKVCQTAYAAQDRAAVKACLKANLDKVSAECRALIEKSQTQNGGSE